MEKRFIIKCECGFSKLSDGTQNDLSSFKEIKDCNSCGGKPRVFLCPKCNGKMKQFRLKGNT